MSFFFRIIDRPQFLRTWVGLCALIPLALGAAWVCTFIFTSYQKELAPVGIPLGIVSFVFGYALFFMYRWAVIASILPAALATLACTFYLFQGYWAYFILVLIGLLYLVTVLRHLALKRAQASVPGISKN